MPSPKTRPVVLVTGAARRLGRAIAIELAHGGFDIALHYRHSASRGRGQRWPTCARSACAPNVLPPTWPTRPPAARWCRRWRSAWAGIDAVVNNASHFEYDSAATFSYAAMEVHWRANTAPAIVLANALAAHLKGCSETGCVVNLLDQKLWNPNPDYFSYTLSKAALEAATTLLAQALAPQVRVAGVAPGVTLVSGPAMSDEAFAAAHRMTPLGRSSTSRRRRARGALHDRVPGHHRHHDPRRWRPAPGRAAARRGLPDPNP